MNKGLKILLTTVAVAITGLFLVSCGGGSTPNNVTPTPNNPSNPSTPNNPSTPSIVAEPFSVSQVAAASLKQEIELKAVVVEVTTFSTKSGSNRVNVYITDKDGKAGALVHFKGEPGDFVKGNYLQFKGVVDEFIHGKQKQFKTRQVQDPKEVKVLEKNVSLPANLKLTTIAQSNDPLNVHKVVDVLEVTVKEYDTAKKHFSFNFDGKFIKFYDRTNKHTFEVGKKYNIKNALITKDTKYAQLNLESFTIVEEVK